MEAYKNVLLWLAAGLVLGGVLFVLLEPQQAQPVIVPTNYTKPVQPAPTPSPQPTPQPVSKSTVNFILIESADCAFCNSADQLLPQTQSYLANSTVLTAGSLTTLNSTSPQAMQLIAQYNITKLPVLLVTGNPGADSSFLSAWTASIGSEESDGTFVSRQVYPPYYDLATSSVAGLVQGVAINATGCPECMDASKYFSSLENPTYGIYFSNKTVLQENDTEAKALIAEYNITALPAFIMSPDISAYPIYSQIKLLGDTENGWFVLRSIRPPYVDIPANNTIRGLVNAVFIVNSSCVSCFNVSSLSDYIEQSAGVTVVNRTTYEANSSMSASLISKYNLTALPALLYSPEVSYYPGFEQTWKNQTSTVESDGWYVFRAYDLISVPYQNITVKG